MSVDLAAARAAKQKVADMLRGAPEVCGFGITRVDGDYAVKLNLSGPLTEFELPQEVDGVAVAVEIVGSIAAQ